MAPLSLGFLEVASSPMSIVHTCCTHVCICVHVFPAYIYIYVYISTCKSMSIYIYVYVHTYVYISVYTHTYTRICMHTYVFGLYASVHAEAVHSHRYRLPKLPAVPSVYEVDIRLSALQPTAVRPLQS